MNFRPTKWKVIVSLILSICGFTFGYFMKKNFVIIYSNNMSSSQVFLLKIIPYFDFYLFSIFLILAYLVWSLFEKPRRKKK